MHCWMLDKSYSSADDKERCLKCGLIRTEETEQAPCQSKPRLKAHRRPSKPAQEEPPPIDPLEIIAALRQLSVTVGLIRLNELPPHTRTRVASAHSVAEELLRKLDRTWTGERESDAP